MQHCPECHAEYEETSVICPSCNIRLVKASRLKKEWAKLGEVLRALLGLKLVVHYCPRCRGTYPDDLVCPSCELGLKTDNSRLRAAIGGFIGALATPVILQTAHPLHFVFGIGLGALIGFDGFGKPGGPGGGDGGLGGDGGGYDIPDVGG